MNKIYLLPQLCEESQLRKNRNYAEALFCSSKKGQYPLLIKLQKSSQIVQNTFTVDAMTTTLNEYDVYLKNCKEFDHNRGRFQYSLKQFLTNPNFLLLAYAKLIERKEVAAGIDNVPTQNITLGGIRKIAKELEDNSYQPHPVRTVYIPKPGKPNQTRPLGVTSTRDKVVQQAIKMLIEPIYETIFLDCSFGFRPGLNCHACLKTISQKWKRSVWFIQADIIKAFDKIQHRTMRRLLNTRIADRMVVNTIDKMVKVGYIQWDNLSESKLENSIGTPQGSILSPLLCNIYMHQLDQFVTNILIPMFNNERTGKTSEEYLETKRITGTEWGPIYNQIVSLTPNVSRKDIRKNLLNIKKIEGMHKDIPYFAKDENHRRLYYIRYADDFLLSFVGPKNEAIQILQYIASFLESELSFSIHPDKSGVEHHTKGVIFLGYHLHGNYELKKQFLKDEDENKIQRKRSNWMKFGIPIHKLFKKYADKGFFQKARKGKQDKYVARRADKWIFLHSDGEVVRRYNAVARGLAEYYSGSQYPSVLTEFWSVLKRSLALTLAHRHKQNSAKKAFNKWGKELQIDEKTKWIRPEMKGGKWTSPRALQGDLKNLLHWQPSGNSFPKTLGSIQNASNLQCSITNCPNMAENWHHLKHRKISKNKNIDLAHVSKQIPVCKAHHILIHNGKYDGPSLRKLPGYTCDTLVDTFKSQE